MGNAALQRPAWAADLQRHMDARPGGNAGPSQALTIEQLAHELNSKLDGSMRTLDLVTRALSADGASAMADLDDVASKLRTVRSTLSDMAGVLRRAFDGAPAVQALGEDRSLGACVDAILAGLRPLALEHEVAMTHRIQPTAAELPAGPLGTVIENGLRNAIEACREAPGTVRRVQLLVKTIDRCQLVVQIVDSGPGPPPVLRPSTKPGGRGVGLTLCRMIVADLDGTLRLSSVLSGPGALLETRVPIRALETP